MTEPIEYRNLITGDRAQAQPDSREYFELHVLNAAPWGYQLSTSEGEFLSAWDAKPTFKEAWFDALTYTTVGGIAYQDYRNTKEDDEALTAKWAEQEGAFDPYAGNLDYLLGY